MIIVLEPNTPEKEVQNLITEVKQNGVEVHRSDGQSYTILGLVGDTSKVQESPILSNKWVHNLVHIQEPYKRANKIFKPEATIIEVAGHKIGGDAIVVMAGPCSVEGKDAVIEHAKAVKEAGAHFLRAGAYKPRSSPYSFQGLGKEGIEYMLEAKKETGLPIVTEIMSIGTLDEFKDVDIIQVGARNMQNFALLKALGKTDKPILLKRGLSSTIEEWLMSAEYILAEGNPNVILCERGIRTFENYTRNTLDVSAVPMVKRLSHLPIIVDPSHAAGLWWMVDSLSKASIAAGADGLIIEVHPDPAHALSDGAQTIKPQQFAKLMIEMDKIAKVLERHVI
ncbi:MAG: 3-deoxy-7-phosphoheptulonate synthase [Clostridia bacterium]|nr:3-deoxy-7-phosphoheptulonate synthase [Clostridia bacterium]